MNLNNILEVAKFLNFNISDYTSKGSFACHNPLCKANKEECGSGYRVSTDDGFDVYLYNCSLCNNLTIYYEPSNLQEQQEFELCRVEAANNGISEDMADKCTFAEIGCPNCFLTKRTG